MNSRKFPLFSKIVPEGWMRQLMHRDLTQGFIGHLDELVPDLIQQDPIYDDNRRTANSKKVDLGVSNYLENMQAQYQWWNAETQSNWLDGFIRTAILDGDGPMLQKAEAIIRRRLNSQDEDGYLGIYKPDLRFHSGKENGEFWAQSALFRALLAYYEYTEDKDVLHAVAQAADCIMKGYPKGQSRPFSAEQEESKWSCHGISHGLTITDTFFQLFGHTGKTEYLDYAVWLYDSYSQESHVERDIQIQNLLDPSYRFYEHGVHTYEHLRTLVLAYYYTGQEKYETALKEYFAKLDQCILPSGAPIGDEWVCGMSADSTLTGYEYCCLQELLHSYALLMQQSGEMKWADKIEWLLFNAGLGSHHPERSSIAYLNVDNAYAMEAVFQTEQPHCKDPKQNRYKYSPTHQDVAVCCVPNAGRIFPYYVQSMWMTEGNRLIKALYGPSRFTQEINGVQVQIEENSNYPYSPTLAFRVIASAPVAFSLVLRKPSWCKGYTLDLEQNEYRDEQDTIVIEKEWNGTAEFTLRFDWDVIINTDLLGDVYFSFGPLVMCLPIPSKETIVKTHPLEGFYDTHYKPAEGAFWDYYVTPEQAQSMTPLEKGVGLTGCATNRQTGKEETITLVPMGKSVLRRVTFPKQ
ncbi:MAG: beta-L-arabinofuranosidase domain-containing protein [Massiliimalia sp.]|jgi:DUF1680 family protein